MTNKQEGSEGGLLGFARGGGYVAIEITDEGIRLGPLGYLGFYNNEVFVPLKVSLEGFVLDTSNVPEHVFQEFKELEIPKKGGLAYPPD